MRAHLRPVPAIAWLVAVAGVLPACRASGPAGARPQAGLPPAALMSAAPLRYALSTGLHVTIPGEFVYPPGVAAAVAPPFPLQGHLEYVDSPDTADSAAAGVPISPRGPACSGRCLVIESLALGEDPEGYARRELRDAILGADRGVILGGLATPLPGAYGWRFRVRQEVATQVAVGRDGVLYVFSMLAPGAGFDAEERRLVAALASLG